MRRCINESEILLQPGEYALGGAGCRIHTLLGSCVSITLWHRLRRIGTMSHFLVCSRGKPSPEPDGRYGEEAMWLMLRELERAGVPPDECEGKIFGGASMFPSQTRNTSADVGKKNGEAARRLLRSYGIPIAAESLFGVGHRRIVFDIHSGYVWARQVEPTDFLLAETGKST